MKCQPLPMDGGYPTETALNIIKTVQLSSIAEAMEFLLCQVVPTWESCGYGSYSTGRRTQYGHEYLVLHMATGGWSGCESLMEAVLSRWDLAHYLQSWYRGGAWVFHLPMPAAEKALLDLEVWEAGNN